MTTHGTPTSRTRAPDELPARLTCSPTDGGGPAHSVEVDVHDWAWKADDVLLADYLYDAGHMFPADLAVAAGAWTRTCTQPGVDDLLARTGLPGHRVELFIDDTVLTDWLSAHRPHVLLAVWVAQRTSSSRWIYDHDLRVTLTRYPPDLARDLVTVLRGMTTSLPTIEDPDLVFAAVLAATLGPAATSDPGRREPTQTSVRPGAARSPARPSST